MFEVVTKTNCFLKNPLFSKKTHCFPTCALFYPIVLKRKIITVHTPISPTVIFYTSSLLGLDKIYFPGSFNKLYVLIEMLYSNHI